MLGGVAESSLESSPPPRSGTVHALTGLTGLRSTNDVASGGSGSGGGSAIWPALGGVNGIKGTGDQFQHRVDGERGDSGAAGTGVEAGGVIVPLAEDHSGIASMSLAQLCATSGMPLAMLSILPAYSALLGMIPPDFQRQHVQAICSASQQASGVSTPPVQPQIQPMLRSNELSVPQPAPTAGAQSPLLCLPPLFPQLQLQQQQPQQQPLPTPIQPTPIQPTPVQAPPVQVTPVQTPSTDVIKPMATSAAAPAPSTAVSSWVNVEHPSAAPVPANVTATTGEISRSDGPAEAAAASAAASAAAAVAAAAVAAEAPPIEVDTPSPSKPPSEVMNIHLPRGLQEAVDSIPVSMGIPQQSNASTIKVVTTPERGLNDCSSGAEGKKLSGSRTRTTDATGKSPTKLRRSCDRCTMRKIRCDGSGAMCKR